MVEFFSAAMLDKVCRYLSWRADGDSEMIIEASFKAMLAFCSPSAAITLAFACDTYVFSVAWLNGRPPRPADAACGGAPPARRPLATRESAAVLLKVALDHLEHAATAAVGAPSRPEDTNGLDGETRVPAVRVVLREREDELVPRGVLELKPAAHVCRLDEHIWQIILAHDSIAQTEDA